jgi:uncharacterized protein (TIGR02172 family)
MNSTPIGNGRTADVVSYDQTHVLKLFKPFMGAASVDHEFRVASVAYRERLPTPRPVEVITQEGRTGIVYDRVDGTSLLRQLSDNPMRMPAIAKTMAELHCKINAVAYADAENTQKKNIERAIGQATDLDANDKARIVAYLRSLPDGDRLCHGDFHPDNVLVGDTPWIIDWMTGSSGNPLGDIARSKLILETSELPDSVPPAMRFIMGLGQRRLARLYVSEYRRISKAKRRDIEAWLLPLYAARLVEHLSEKETRVILAKIRKEMKRRKLTA